MRPRSRAAALTVALALPFGLASSADADSGWQAPPEAAREKSPLPQDEATTAAGKAVFEARCANCHGLAGKGDGKSSAFLKVKPSDLTTEDEAAATDGELFWKVTTGRMPMPAFEKKLSATERWQVVRYLRHLQMVGGTSQAAPSPAEPSASPAGSKR